jgi:hypothetical protein
MRNWLFIALVSVAACGSKSKNEPTTGGGEGANLGDTHGGQEGVVVGPPEKAWADMSKEERARWMGAKVLPTMKPLFAAYDPEFKDMNCETCHGDGAKDHSFTMPNPKLPKLPKDEAAFGKFAADHPQAVDFMMKTVKPQMAELLGLEEWSPDHPDGFSCGNCHTTE